MKIFIVEDEKPALNRLIHLLKEIDSTIEIIGHSDSIESTLHAFQQAIHPDLILMDIELADGQSFEIFKQIKINAPIIFTTAYDEFALQAFKLNSVDYLLKPIVKVELEQALKKYNQIFAKTSNTHIHSIEQLMLHMQIQSKTYKNRFLIRNGNKYIPMEIDGIAYFFSYEKATWLMTHTGRKYTLDETLEELILQLNPNYFFAINRQFIASFKSISSVLSSHNGKLKIQLEPKFMDDEIFISREKASLFKDWLNR